MAENRSAFFNALLAAGAHRNYARACVMIGSLVAGRYEIVKLIGEGGMGAVYEATDSKIGRRVAVKVISDEEVSHDDVLVARFEREAQAAATVHSPHIVEILDSGHDDATGHPYMVMELLEGDDVLQVLQRLGPLPPDLAVRIGIETCRGLEKAHQVGVVHRDIKPANLFLHRAQSGELIVKLLDFGVAKFKMDQAQASQNQSLTRTGSMLGSPMYMSPEQARGLKNIDQRADLWSLGIVMYQLLTGRQPHEEIEGLGELIITICSEPPEPITKKAPWCSDELAAVVVRALKLKSEERFQSAHDMAIALGRCLEGARNEPLGEEPGNADEPLGEEPGGGPTIDASMLVPLSAEQRALQGDCKPAKDGDAKQRPAAGVKDDATVALADPDRYDISSSDAKTIALEKEDVPASPPAMDNASRGVEPEHAAPEPLRHAAEARKGAAADPDARAEALSPAQRAALSAARLPSEDAPSQGGVPWMWIVVLVALAAIAGFLALGR